MSTKLNVSGIEIELNETNKAPGKRITEEELLKTRPSLGQDKGVTSLSKFSDYYFTGEYRILPPVNAGGKEYLAFEVALLDKTTHKEKSRGAISFNSLTRDKTYVNPETREQETVRIFPDIPAFRDEEASPIRFMKENFKGRIFRADEEVNITPPQFVNNQPVFMDNNGIPFATRKTYTFRELKGDE